MLAKEIMTTRIISATPEMPVKAIAQLLLDNGISALPVVDAQGKLLGMVSEGDLTGRNLVKSSVRSEWWLDMLAEGEALSPEFLASLQHSEHTAQEIMSCPVITVNEDTDIREIARLLTEYHIKRVPVMADDRVTGIVSRSDLLRVIVMSGGNPLSGPEHKDSHDGYLHRTFSSLDRHFHPAAHLVQPKPHAEADTNANKNLTAQSFRTLMGNFRHDREVKEKESELKSLEQHKKQVADIINHHIDDAAWQSLLHMAQEAASRGDKEYMLLRLPNELCIDGGRSINVGEETWTETLRGEAAEIYMRWKNELRPQGFHISARVLEYPGGFPGDIGLFLMW